MVWIHATVEFTGCSFMLNWHRGLSLLVRKQSSISTAIYQSNLFLFACQHYDFAQSTTVSMFSLLEWLKNHCLIKAFFISTTEADQEMFYVFSYLRTIELSPQSDLYTNKCKPSLSLIELNDGAWRDSFSFSCCHHLLLTGASSPKQVKHAFNLFVVE